MKTLLRSIKHASELAIAGMGSTKMTRKCSAIQQTRQARHTPIPARWGLCLWRALNAPLNTIRRVCVGRINQLSAGLSSRFAVNQSI